MRDELRRALASTLGATAAPLFLAVFDPDKSKLTLHVRAGCDRKRLRAEVQSAIERTEEAVDVSVRAHSLRKLAHPRSLEHWVGRFGAGEPIYDPTMILSRARELVAAAKACRASFGEAVRAVFFDPHRRSMLVLAGKSNAIAFADLRARLKSWATIEVVAQLPQRAVVPVDAGSASLLLRAGRVMRRWFAPVALAAALTGLAAPAAAHSQRSADLAQPQQVRAGDFGVLAGLAVFSDGQFRQELDAFSAAGLRQYFGESQPILIRIAQRAKKKRDPDEVGQVQGGPGGTGS